jgi:hypothetical protein
LIEIQSLNFDSFRIYAHFLLELKLPLPPVILPRPNTRLTRRDNAIWINRILDVFIEPPENVVVKGVRIHDLIHGSKMSAILAPAFLCAVVDQGLEEPMGTLLLVFVLAVECYAYDVI